MSLHDDVALAIRRVFQLGQTYWQQADSESYKENGKSGATFEKYKATLAETSEIAARADARIAELEQTESLKIMRLEMHVVNADARIAELERECSQWRDELRIFRETENKRIAELERSVTVRDTEIARLETDLELARRDAERYRLEPTPEQCADMAEWHSEHCLANGITRQDSAKYGMAIVSAVKVVMFCDGGSS